MKPAQNINLLIADDHKLFNEGLKYILEDEFKIKNIQFANSGKEAIELCLKEKFDVVIMDVNMPIINGVDACIEIKRYNPEVIVIFISMLSDLLTVAAALKAGADAYVLKGNGHEDISAAFNNIFYQKERFLSHQLRHYFIDENPNKVFQNNNEYVSFSDNLITSREKQVLKMICEGLTNEKIAEILSISIRTVDTHRTNLLTKLKLPNTASLVRFAVENKLID